MNNGPIRFVEKTHRYWLDGKPVPSVTTIINGGWPKPALVYWSAKTVAEYVADNDATVTQMWKGMGRDPMVAALKAVPWEKRDKAGVRGTDVHTYAEHLLHGTSVEVPEHIAGYVDSCARFLDDFHVEPIFIERSCANRPHWWAGRFDLIGRIGADTALIDWKTTQSGIYPEAAIQLSAYAHAEFLQDDTTGEQIPMPHIDLALGVHLRPDGYDAITLDSGDDTYRLFRHISVVAKAQKTDRELVGPPLTHVEVEVAS